MKNLDQVKSVYSECKMMSQEELQTAYEQGHYDGWHQVVTTNQDYNIGLLAAEYAQGYFDGRKAEKQQQTLLGRS